MTHTEERIMDTRERINILWQEQRAGTAGVPELVVRSGDGFLSLPWGKQREWVPVVIEADGAPLRPTDDAPDLSELTRAARRQIRTMATRRLLHLHR